MTANFDVVLKYLADPVMSETSEKKGKLIISVRDIECFFLFDKK